MALNFSAPFSLFGGGASMPGFSNGATGRVDQNGSVFDTGNDGAWSVNIGGSGKATQSATATSTDGDGIPWLWIAGAAGVVWLLMRR